MRRSIMSLSAAGSMLPLLAAAAPATRPAPYTPPPARYFAPPQAPVSADAQVTPGLALSRKLPEVKFSEIPLGDAIDYVQNLTGANIHVNWRAMELLNVTRQTPVSLTLRDVTMRRVLRSLLDETGVGEMLTFYADDEVLEVTTREIADSQMVTRVYPVEDLVATVPDFAGPTFNLQNQTNTASGGGGGGGGGSSIFSGSATNEQLGQGGTKEQRAESLVKLITETVRPEVWRDNGGTASVRYFNGHLIVTAPRSVQDAIGAGREATRPKPRKR